MNRHSLLALAAIVSLLTGAVTTISAAPATSSAPQRATRQISRRGTTTLPAAGGVASAPGAAATASSNNELSGARNLVNRSHTPRPDAAAIRNAQPAAATLAVPVVNSTRVGPLKPGLSTSFQGLNFFDQRTANGGNQFSVEPPDQGLCVGNGLILETVNSVLRVYNTAGTPQTGVVDLNTFYGYPPAINRTTGVRGPEITDPSCYFDPEHQRWVHIALTLEVNPATGAFTLANHLDIAVSQTASPIGGWVVYSLAVQNDGTQGTPTHTDCPCLGDYPHIGADANGVYITTNEYPWSSGPGVFGNNFNGAQLYAISKQALAANAPVITIYEFASLQFANGIPGFTVWPAQSPVRQYATLNGGTEYFLSSVAGQEALSTTGIDNRIGLWALSNTSSLNSNGAGLGLTSNLLASETYGVPPRSEQKVGSVPLRDCLVSTCRPGIGPSPAEVEGPLDSNDSRMQQVWYANGNVWGALDTIVNVGSNIKAGVAYFRVVPTASVATAGISQQGYVAVNNNNVTYPALAILGSGEGVMAVNLVGEDYFPSAAYMHVGRNGSGDIHIARAGVGPQDGFSEYNFYANTPPFRPRWGDYAAAVTDGNKVWLASEYIAQTCTVLQYQADPTCGGTRGTLGNWSTAISAVRP